MNGDAQVECGGMQGFDDGVHAALGRKSAHAEFQMGNHVQHGGCPVGVAAIVGGVAVKQLTQFLVASPRIPLV